jgi:N-acetylglucosaminyl-diphospho-decaprenol L-rhamnosyltransferase
VTGHVTGAKPGAGVAAVVVNYNTAEHLRTCLRSLACQPVTEVVVVDNGSVDGSRLVAEEAGVRWIETGANLGYGGAANRGVAEMKDRSFTQLLISNADIDLRPGAVAALVAAFDRDPALALVGPALYNPDGSLYPSARTFPDLVVAMGHGVLGLVAPRNRFTRKYRLLDWDHGQAARVDWISGACFLVRRDSWEAVGGFDPAYFMYLEDVDLCWRLHLAGSEVGYEPAAQVVHVQGVSTDRHPYRMLAAHHQSMWRFARRTSAGPRRLALPLVGAGLAVRLGLAMLEHRLGSVWPGADQSASV